MIQASFECDDTIESSYAPVDRLLPMDAIPRTGDEVSVEETGMTWVVKRLTWILPESDGPPLKVIVVLH